MLHSFYTKLTTQPLFYFTSIFLLIFITYLPGHSGMLVDDGLSGIWEIQKQQLGGFLQSYGCDRFYHGHYAILFLLFSIASFHTISWFILYTILLSINSTLVFFFFKKFFTRLVLCPLATPIALSTSVWFALQPYMIENILWAATSHYAFTFMILFAVMYLLMDNTTAYTIPNIILSHLGFALALVTLEISFIYPLVWGGFMLLQYILHVPELKIRSYIQLYLLPQILLVACYAICYKYVYDYWFPHDRLGRNIEVHSIHYIQTLMQRLFMQVSLIQYADYPLRHWWYSRISSHAIPLSIILFSSVALYLLFKKNKKAAWIMVWLLSMWLLFSLPFMRHYFMYLFRYENIRYLYFSSVFIYALVAYILISRLRYLNVLLLVSSLCVFIYFDRVAANHRALAGKIHQDYIEHFPNNTNGKHFLLNVPSYVHDVYVFRYSDRLKIALETYQKDVDYDNIIQVSGYLSHAYQDSITVDKINDSTYKVYNYTPDSWWIREALGAVSYENDQYFFEKDEWNGYLLRFKQKLSANDKLWLFVNGRFVNVK